MKLHTILCLAIISMTVIGLISCQKSTAKNKTNNAQIVTNENDLYYPSSIDRLERCNKTVYENPDANTDLTQFEADIRNSLAITGKPNAWQNLDPNLTIEEYKKNDDNKVVVKT